MTRGFVISGTFLAVLLIIGGVTLLAGGDRPAPARPAARVPTRPPATDGCPLLPGVRVQKMPLRPPAAHWTPLGVDQQVPGSTINGPARERGHVRSCYAHSPTGAVFAAYGFFAAQWEFPDDTKMLSALTAQSEARDEAIVHGGSPPHDPDWTVTLVGFRVRDYARTAVTVLLAARAAPTPDALLAGQQAESRLASAQIRLRWERGDWKVVAEPDGFKPELLDSLAGLVPWSARS